MDINMIYALLVVSFVLALVFGINYLKVKKILKINVDDLLFIVTTFNLSLEIIDEFNLKYESQIKAIGKVVNDTLDFIKENYLDSDNLDYISYHYAINLANDFGLRLDDNKRVLIKKLLEIGIDNIKK